MPRFGFVAALLAALGVGWFIGASWGGGGAVDSTDDELVALREDVARLRIALGERSGAAARTAELGAGEDPGASGREPPPADSRTFDVMAFDDAGVAFRALLAHGATMLDAGEDGHQTLLRTIDATFYAAPGAAHTDKLVGGAAQKSRYLYAVLRFAMNRDDQVGALAETVFRTMAEDPGRFEGLASGTLAIFTDRVAPMLPGLLGPTRMDRLRAQAKAVLAAAQSTQPACVQRVREDVQEALAAWAPPMAPAEAFLRLQRGDLSPEEASALLRRLDRASLAQLDVDTVIGPLIEHDPWRVIETLSRARLDEAMMGRLDTRILVAAAAGTLKQAVVHFWLRYTGRASFEKARTFLERGLQQASKATAGTFLLTALATKPPPDAAWIAWAEKRYEFSEDVRVALMRLREGK